MDHVDVGLDQVGVSGSSGELIKDFKWRGRLNHVRGVSSGEWGLYLVGTVSGGKGDESC